MTTLCPAGHASDESDYCSVCGTAIGSSPRLTPTPPLTVVQRAGSGGCPICGEPRLADARFCEVCRYDFVTHAAHAPTRPAAAPKPVAAAAPPPAPSPVAAKWELVVSVDATLDVDPDPSSPPPGDPERVFSVDVTEMLIGRRDDRQNIRPAVPLHDPGASRRHARVVVGSAGEVSLHALASTNGTKHNGRDVQPGVAVPLQNGDVVTLGRWTRIVFRGKP